jgi:hypothetical protein
MDSIPVQVGTRIVDLVDPARADAMSSGANVRVIRARGKGKIVRLIIKPHELVGSAEEHVETSDSRSTTFRERLFTDHEPSGDIRSPFVFQFKPSSTYRSSGRRVGSRRVPTTSPAATRSGEQSCL